MLCNNVKTRVSIGVNYGICVVHSIAQGTFFLDNGARRSVSNMVRLSAVTRRNFMLMRINYELPRYKADQY